MANKSIGTLGTIPSLNIGGVVMTDLSNLIVLGANLAAGPTHWTTFREPNGTAGYEVTASKTFDIWAISVERGAPTADRLHIFYTDNDLGLNTTEAKTNEVVIFGDAAIGFMTPLRVNGDRAVWNLMGKYKIPAGKYVSCSQGVSAGTNVMIYGYENAV